MKSFGGWLIVIVAVIFTTLLAANVHADERHHHTTTIENTTYIENANSYTSLAIASGQHHYKATTSLQWSVGAGYIDDSSAVSFGLGLQTGKVFISGNFSSDGSNSAIGVSASGTF